MAKPPPPPSSKLITDQEERRVEEDLSYPILLSERVRKSANEAVSFKSECADVAWQAERLSHLLRSAVRLNSASSYSRPVPRIAADASRNLDRALTLTRKCRRRSLLRRVVNIVSAADFRRLSSLLDASAADLRWLLTILDYSDAGDGGGGGGGYGLGIDLSLPPIASNDPILAWIWSFIASVHLGPLGDRIEAANELASLALDNDRNKKIIVEEGGIPPLLKLLKEDSSPDAQMAAATALCNLVNITEWANSIVESLGVPSIVQILQTSPTRVQIKVARLVAKMSEFSHIAKEEFARENVIRPLVSLLSFETFEDGDQKLQPGKHQSIHSIVQMNKEMAGKKETKGNSINHPLNLVNHHQLRPRLESSLSFLSEGSSKGGGQYRKEREKESPEVKREMKIRCAEALWMLARDSISNSRRITETKGLLCLAKLVEKEEGELQRNCLMAIMEITTAAESNADLRRSAFKTNSPAAKAVVGQLLRMIKEPRDRDPSIQIPAIKSIGCLARTFPARESCVIGPLVDQLSNKNQEAATVASIALEKFASPENFLCKEHSKSIIEFSGILPIMRLLRANDWTQYHSLVLLCYLAIHASDNEALERSRVLTALEGADRTAAVQNKPQLKELINTAVYQLKMYQNDGIHLQRQTHPL